MTVERCRFGPDLPGTRRLAPLDVFLGRGQAVAKARIECGGGVQCAGEGLEHSFDFVVCVAAVERDDVDVHPGLTGDGVKEVPHKIGFKLPDVGPGKVSVLDKPGSSTAVNRDVRQGFVHRDGNICCPADSPVVAKCLPDRLSQTDTGILDRVMPVDVQVSLDGQRQVKLAVTCEQGQKVIECPDAGVDIGHTGSVNREIEHDARFGRRAPD